MTLTRKRTVFFLGSSVPCSSSPFHLNVLICLFSVCSFRLFFCLFSFVHLYVSILSVCLFPSLCFLSVCLWGGIVWVFWKLDCVQIKQGVQHSFTCVQGLEKHIEVSWLFYFLRDGMQMFRLTRDLHVCNLHPSSSNRKNITTSRAFLDLRVSLSVPVL